LLSLVKRTAAEDQSDWKFGPASEQRWADVCSDLKDRGPLSLLKMRPVPGLNDTVYMSDGEMDKV
jgi:hypothetical protein